MPRSLRLAGFTATAALVVLGTPADAAVDCGEGWRRVDGVVSTLYTPASERVARRLAADLDSFQAFLAGLEPNGKYVSPTPMVVVALRDQRELQELRRPGTYDSQIRLGGFFVGSEEIAFVVLDSTADADMGLGDVVYHELVHAYLRHTLPSAPRWLQEGFAEFFSTFQRSSSEVVVGRTIDRHLRWLAQNGLAPMAEVLGARPIEGGEVTRIGVAYSQSWLFVHYLLTGGEPTRVQLARFLEGLRDREPVLLAFQQAFGMTVEDMTPVLNRYLNGGRFGFYRIPVEAHESELSIVAPPPAEACATLGELLAHLPGRVLDARAYFARAQALDSENPLALSGLGRLAAAAGKTDEALEWFERSVAGEPETALTWYRYGNALLDRLPRVMGGTLDAEDQRRLAAARAALGEAIRRRPSYGVAFAALARSHLIDLATPISGVAAGTRAVALMPYRYDLVIDLALLTAAAGAYERSFELIDTRLAKSVTPEQVSSARRDVTRLILTRAAATLDRDDAPEASRALEAVEKRWAGQLPEELAGLSAALRSAIAAASSVPAVDPP